MRRLRSDEAVLSIAVSEKVGSILAGLARVFGQERATQPMRGLSLGSRLKVSDGIGRFLC